MKMTSRKNFQSFIVQICYVMILVAMARAQENIVTIRNGSNIMDYLCGNKLNLITNNTTIELDPGAEHVIASRQQFCILWNKSNITLQSSGSKIVIVKCEGNNIAQSGFGFVGINNLTIRNIQFENCGGIVNDTTLAPPNTSPESLIRNKQQAVLLLSRCIKVQFENVTISNYRGYAVFAINSLGDITIQRMNVTNSISVVRQITSSNRSDLIESGSGIIFHFNDQNESSMPLLHYNSSRIRIMESTIANNFNIYPQPWLKSIRATRLQNQPADFPVPGAGGLTVHIEQRHYRVQLFVENVMIAYNGGSVSGGTQVFSRNTIDHADINFSRCTFKNNTILDLGNYTGGGGLQLIFVFSYSSLPMVSETAGMTNANITIEKTDFISHFVDLAAAVLVFNEPQNVSPISIKFSRVHFLDNEATIDADCILVRNERSAYYREEKLEILLESVQVEHSGRSSLKDTTSALSFINVDFVTITGSESYPGIFSNGENSALQAYDTNLFLSGKLKFIQNHALQGGAVSLRANSYVFFMEPADILFSNNTAEIAGGAVFSDTISGFQCVMQFITSANEYSTNVIQDVSKLGDLNFTITFADNSATDGKSIYAKPLYGCSWFSESVVQIPSNQVDDVYKELFYFSVNGTKTRHTSEIRSYPFQPCFCRNETLPSDESECLSYLSINTFPGKSFAIAVVSTDVLGMPLGSLVEARVSGEDDIVTFQSGMTIVVHELNGGECSHLEYTMYSSDNITAKLNFSIPNTLSQTIEAEVHLQSCPIGFRANPDSGTCDCAPVFSRCNVTCDIETGKFTKSGTLWIGTTEHEDLNPVPACATRCPEGYCKNSQNVLLNITNGIPQNESCLGNRTGEICGKCIPGYSMKFGTTKCDPNCSNYYLFTIPVYMLAGILLVFILFLLKISTASGTLIVVLYYAQLISINLGLLIQTNETQFAFVFISLLNLELGFPLCFYAEMDLIGKQWLQFVFPVYLWLLVILLTIISRYSAKVSNLIGSDCVKVFVTLIFLCYTKILRTAFAVLVPTYVRTDDQTRVVWFFDGTEKFLTGSHLYLTIVSIIFLVFIIAPYKIFLFSAQWSLKSSWISRKFKPLIDASLAPFKDRYRFWFGLRLMIIAILVIVAISFSPNYPDVVTYVHLVIIFCLAMFQAYIKPYKSKAVNMLDIFFLMNYILFLIGCLFVFSGIFSSVSSLIPYIAAVELISIGTAFIVFVGVVIYHIVERVKGHNKKTVNLDLSDRNLETSPTNESVVVTINTGPNRNTQIVTSTSVDMSRLREPLLEDEY